MYQTPWSVFQDGSDGHRPTSHRLQQAHRRTATSIEHTVQKPFRAKHTKTSARHTLGNGTLHALYCRPHISGEIEPISLLNAVRNDTDRHL